MENETQRDAIALLESLKRTPAKKVSTQSTSITTLSEVSYTRAKLIEYLTAFGADRDHLITELKSIQRSHKEIGEVLAEELEPSFLSWVGGLAPMGDRDTPIEINAKDEDGIRYSIPAHVAVTNSAKYLLECLYTLPNVLFFGQVKKSKKGVERRSAALSENGGKGFQGATAIGTDEAKNWGIRIQPTYLVQHGKAGERLYKGIELVASLTQAIVTGDSQSRESIKSALTGEAGDSRFEWPVEFVQALCTVRFRGLLYAGIRELLAKVKNDLTDQAKLNAFIESEKSALPMEFTAPLANVTKAIAQLSMAATSSND